MMSPDAHAEMWPNVAGFLLGSRQPLCVPAGLAASVGLTSGGFALQTCGLKDGNSLVVSVCTCNYEPRRRLRNFCIMYSTLEALPLPMMQWVVWGCRKCSDAVLKVMSRAITACTAAVKQHDQRCSYDVPMV